MKKQDIIKLITAQNAIKKNEKLLSTIQTKYFHTSQYKHENFWFPKIPELQEYFNILKKELKDAKKETEEAAKIIMETKCTHDIRLNYHGLFSSSNICVLCGHCASSDNTISFYESAYRNKHTITFPAKNQEDDDGPYQVEDGKTNEELYAIINHILKKFNDDDEVDLVEEFSKLDLKKMTINKEKRKSENYVLIIGGTNQEYLDKNQDIYLGRIKALDSTNFITYFSGILNTKVAVIENSDILNNPEIKELDNKHNTVFIQNYTTLNSLKSSLYQVQKIPFKLIIDLTELYDYEIHDSKVTSTPHSLNLQEIFPQSKIIHIHPLSTYDNTYQEKLEELTANEIFQTIQSNPKYYYQENDKVLEKTPNETYHHLKMLLRK